MKMKQEGHKDTAVAAAVTSLGRRVAKPADVHNRFRYLLEAHLDSKTPFTEEEVSPY